MSFNTGDKVRLNGTEATIKSWPAELPGWFSFSYINQEGGEVTGTQWYGLNSDGTEHPSSAHLELVSAAEPVDSEGAPPVPAADDLRDQSEPSATEPLSEDSGYPGVPDEIG